MGTLTPSASRPVVPAKQGSAADRLDSGGRHVSGAASVPRRRRPAGLAPTVALLVIGALLTGCRRAEEAPRLAGALAIRGTASERARAFARVAIKGESAERRRAGFLWGLFACEAGAPMAGLSGFAVAAPTGGRAVLAVRRLEEALAEAGAGEAAWGAATGAPWLAAGERARLAVRGAERLLQQGDGAAALRLLPDPATLRGDERARALAVRARADRAGSAAAARALAIEFPHRLRVFLPDEKLSMIAATFSATEWTAQARAWLGAGEPQAALAAATRASRDGALVAAQAALRLRRSSEALAWASRLGERSAEGWVERADAYRQIAWGGPREQRARQFMESLRCSRQAAILAGPGSPLSGRIALQHGEALSELGRAGEAAAWLTRPEAATQPRWEWVARRFFLLQGQHDRLEMGPSAWPWATTRARRLAWYWRARVSGERPAIEALATSGFPDLPAQWASQRVGVGGVAVSLADVPVPRPDPPAWARDLLAVGRVADAVVAWRADLETETRDCRAWLGLLGLGELPPLDAIPLLVRGEPRLATGPWTGLQRELLERYLPLPWRAELEAAAARARVPPWVLAGLVRQESAWNPRAISSAGAVGLTQLLPATARELVREAGLPASWTNRLTDPGANLAIGALLLRRWQSSFGGSWPPTLASYNAGERRVREVWERAGRGSGPEFVESIEIPETHDYVHRVSLFAEGYRVLYWPTGKAYPWT